MTRPELNGPIKGARFIHQAILNEAADFQNVATSLSADDEHAGAGLTERLAAFEQVLKLHEDGEDLTIFPQIQQKLPKIAETYEYDHRVHRDRSAALEAALAELEGARGARRRELVKLVGERAIAFNAYMNLHIDKEDLLLFPTYDETFSPEEQMAHGAAAQGHIDPQAMAAAGAWAFQRLDADYREGFLRQMMAMLPPAGVAGLTNGLSQAVSPNDWQEMVSRIPELTSKSSAAVSG